MLCWTLKILTKMVPLSIMGCPVINSFSLSRNSVTIRFFGSRCGTEFGVGDTYQESAPGKGREQKQEWTERESGLQCGSDTALTGSGWRVGGSGVIVAGHRGPGSCRNSWVLPALFGDLVMVAQEMHALGWGRSLVAVRERCPLPTLFTARQPELPWKGDLGNSSPGLSESTICTFEVYFPWMFQGWLLHTCSGPLPET